jgi:hypothetical protein
MQQRTRGVYRVEADRIYCFAADDARVVRCVDKSRIPLCLCSKWGSILPYPCVGSVRNSRGVYAVNADMR